MYLALIKIAVSPMGYARGAKSADGIIVILTSLRRNKSEHSTNGTMSETSSECWRARHSIEWRMRPAYLHKGVNIDTE